MKKPILIISLLALQCSFLSAQKWFDDMYDPSVNFFVVQQEFNDWWRLNGQEVLNAGQQSRRSGSASEVEGKWQIYKRWEHQLLPGMMANGGVRQGAFDSTEFNHNNEKRLRPVEGPAAVWSYIGPQQAFNFEGLCKGRLNCVRFDPVDSSTIYVGAPSGGIWKSTDAGQTWVLLNTDTLKQIGVTDIAINPNNNQDIFIATGDYANDACFSIGVLESTNGGQSWNTTGFTRTIAQGTEISRLLMNPSDPSIMFAATNQGIYKTTDGGTTWLHIAGPSQVSSMEFKPGDPNVIYACNTRLYRSINGGVSWTYISSGLPGPGTVNALAIGVTPADTSCVYVLASTIKQSQSSFGSGYDSIGGLYRSEDGGATFALRSVPSQLVTQGVYDLNVDVSPLNSNVLVVAAVQTAYSNDGGQTFNYAATDAHVDNHDIRFFPNSADKVYSADDGGLFFSSDGGNTWTGLNNGLNIGQLYAVGPSDKTAYLDLTGRQDDGTLLQDGSLSSSLSGADGTNCIIDPTSDGIMYGSADQGIIGKSVDGGLSYSIIAANWETGANGMGNWVTPYLLNPQNHNSLYLGKDFVYKSTNGGNTWVRLNSPALASGSYWFNLVVAPSDTNYIYAATTAVIYKSTDNGHTFTNITSTLANINNITVSSANPSKIWAATTLGVYYSDNAGTSWTNISTGLPTSTSYFPYSITYLNNSPDALYTGLGNGGGVYYIDSTLSSWVPYGSGLPDALVYDLQVSYPAGKIRAATYGRDLWEINLYNNWYNPPVAQFQLSSETCTGQPLQLNDLSSFSPSAWQWTFTGGSPSSSTSQSPIVSYAAAGVYNVTLTVTNAYGSNTISDQVSVGSCTGISPISAGEPAISLYPNPSTGIINVDLHEAALSGASIEIYDNEGRLVHSQKIDRPLFSVDANSFAPGIYWYAVKADATAVRYGKFVKL